MDARWSKSKKRDIENYLKAANDWVYTTKLVHLFGSRITVQKHLLWFYYQGMIDMEGSTRDRRAKWIQEDE